MKDFLKDAISKQNNSGSPSHHIVKATHLTCGFLSLEQYTFLIKTLHIMADFYIAQRNNMRLAKPQT